MLTQIARKSALVAIYPMVRGCRRSINCLGQRNISYRTHAMHLNQLNNAVEQSKEEAKKGFFVGTTLGIVGTAMTGLGFLVMPSFPPAVCVNVALGVLCGATACSAFYDSALSVKETAKTMSERRAYLESTFKELQCFEEGMTLFEIDVLSVSERILFEDYDQNHEAMIRFMAIIHTGPEWFGDEDEETKRMSLVYDIDFLTSSKFRNQIADYLEEKGYAVIWHGTEGLELTFCKMQVIKVNE